METTKRTTKKDRIFKNIQADKNLMKAIQKNSYYSIDTFYKDCNDYIKAIRDSRMIVNIGSVSSSGMKRTMKFLSCEKTKGVNKYYYRQYYSLFEALGFKSSKDGYFTITGCGMDMVFYTNYSIISRLARLGFVSQKDSETLQQSTPTTI